MSNTYSNLLYHIVFSTSGRRELIKSGKEELYRYATGIIRGEGGYLIKIGGAADHVHIFAKFPPVISISDMVRKIKSNTSKWINENKKYAFPFSWQRGYGVFSVSESGAEKVIEYIENQEIHHKKMGFKEELLSLLKKHNVRYDEKYLWD